MPAIPTQDLRRQRLERLRQARQARWQHRFRRLKRAVIATTAIFAASVIIALYAGGIGIEGLVLMIFAMVLAFVNLALFPRPRNPAIGAATRDLRELVDGVQPWLEAQRRSLPNTAHSVLDLLASRLHELSPHLTALNENEPAAREIRKLVGEHLPSLIESYTRIPEALRRQPHAGSTPEEQLLDGLVTVSREVETIGSTVARGELDALAIRGRFLEARYGPPD